MFSGYEDLGAIVADIGTCSARIGFAGDDYPKAYHPSVFIIFHISQFNSMMMCLLFSRRLVVLMMKLGKAHTISTSQRFATTCTWQVLWWMVW
jgi:hypothetical protein